MCQGIGTNMHRAVDWPLLLGGGDDNFVRISQGVGDSAGIAEVSRTHINQGYGKAPKVEWLGEAHFADRSANAKYHNVLTDRPNESAVMGCGQCDAAGRCYDRMGTLRVELHKYIACNAAVHRRSHPLQAAIDERQGDQPFAGGRGA